MIASVCPDISTFGSRISKSLKEQLSANIVCANVVATEGMSDTKYKPILDWDGSHDKARKPQEATNIRVVDKSTGRPKIIGLEFSKLRHQDACTTRDAMFSTLQKHRVSQAVAEKKMVSVSVDGASVNMGRQRPEGPNPKQSWHVRG